jgi:LacI family transcriptional regulator
VVQLDRQVSSRVHYVGMDHPLAMRMLLDHLGSTGRTGFVHLAASPTSAASYERRREYLRYFAHTADRDRVLVGDHSFDWGVHGARQAIEAWPEIDAIVCGNDLIAVGALHALSGLGVEVPEQVAVTGFDDSLRPLVGWPALTTIRQPLAEMARRALTLLSIEGDTTRLRLPGELVVRDSSTCKGAAPRGSRGRILGSLGGPSSSRAGPSPARSAPVADATAHAGGRAPRAGPRDRDDVAARRG